jgi:hypothetical protein
MSTESTSPPANSRSFVDFAVGSPLIVGFVLLVLAMVVLGFTGWSGYKGFSKPKEEIASPDKPATPDLAKPAANLNTGDYLWGLVLGLCAATPLVIAGIGFLTSPSPVTDWPAARTRVRLLLLGAGGLFGIVLMLAGLIFFIRWSDGLIKFLNGGTLADIRDLRYTFIALVVGAGSLLFAIQPARAEERNNPLHRRLVYGSNLALVLLLLGSVLIAANVVAGQKVPNKLDTTETGFYTLAPETEAVLQHLDKPVTAYAILPESGDGDLSRIIDDTRRLLLKCQEASNGKFTVKSSSITSRSEFDRLSKRYPKVELNGLGVLLTTGEDENQYSFIGINDFRSLEGRGPGAKESFVGESKLVKELVFLTENKSKPIVYFTQSNGELSIAEPKTDAGQLPREKSALKLKEYLEKNFIEVKPLEFKIEKAEVPADATVVVVSQPASPLSKDAVDAIRQFMTVPKADGKKGKLVVLAGTPFPPAGPVPKTGLEDLMKEFNVSLADDYLYGERADNLPPEAMEVTVFPPTAQAGNPVAKAFHGTIMTTLAVRGASALKERQELQALPLLVTVPGRITWQEQTPPADPEQTFLDIRKNPALIQSKRATQGARSVAVVVSEGPTGRAAVFGNSLFVTDAVAGASGTPKAFELFGGTIDWLRDRTTIAPGVASKTYTDYRVSPTLDAVRVLWLPLGLAVLAISGIGAGVWVLRRK